jgi:putative DNA primase/helicase
MQFKELLAIAPAADSEHPYLKEKHARPGDLRIVPQNADDLPDRFNHQNWSNWQEVKALREENPDSIVLTAGDLLLAAQDVHGQIWSVQTIQPSGAKLFAAGSKKEITFMSLVVRVRDLAALDAAPAIVIAEGYATADTLSQALGYPVIAAFDSGNLPKVAKDLHENTRTSPSLSQVMMIITWNPPLAKTPARKKRLKQQALVNGVRYFRFLRR